MAPRLADSVFRAKVHVAQRPELRMNTSLRRSEQLPAAVLVELQGQRSSAIALHAFDHVPFYRRMYRETGFTRADIAQPEVFSRLPILNKQDLRDGKDDFLSDVARPRNLLASSTGGSTGQPLRVFHDRRTPTAALWWRPYRWWGLTPAADVAHIYRRSRTARQELFHRLQWWPTRHILLNARGMDTASMVRFARQWRAVQPQLLNGYVDGIHEFAQFVLDEGILLRSPAAIAVTASVLTTSQRSFIETALGAPVFDCYRSAEIPWIAAQCNARVGLHVMADIRRVEIVDSDDQAVPDGVEGEIVISDLLNSVFPLIRYRIGDRSSLRTDPCRCGRTLPLMQSVQGRIVDVLRAPDGRMVTGGFGGLFNKWPTSIHQFQVHQAADYSVTLLFVSGPVLDDAERAAREVVTELEKMMGPTVPIRAERVDRIEHVGGKVRLVTSDAA